MSHKIGSITKQVTEEQTKSQRFTGQTAVPENSSRRENVLWS